MHQTHDTAMVHPRSVELATALLDLDRAQILTPDIRAAVIAHAMPLALANALIALHQADLWTTGNRTVANFFANRRGWDRALNVLQRAGMLTQANFYALVSHPNSENLVTLLSESQQMNSLIQPMFDWLIRNPTHFLFETEDEGDLARLVRHRESLMRSFSQAEERRLQQTRQRYAPQVAAAGGDAQIMDELKQDLEARYTANAARIVRDNGASEELPCTWDALQALSLNAAEQLRAFQAYYAHSTHSAMRFLSKPNHWMHSEARHINRIGTERWSCFEQHYALIVLLYVAVKDRGIAERDGFTPETRVAQFMLGLTDAARAHNWDKAETYLNAQGYQCTRQVDDGEADKPSCHVGIAGHLFNRVRGIGHPLLNIVDKTSIEAELRSFVRQHMQEVITEDNRERIGELIAIVIEGDTLKPEQLETLSHLNITTEQQADFIQHLTDTYAESFSNDASLQGLITDAFKLGTAESHVIKFLSRCDLGDVLKHVQRDDSDTLAPKRHCTRF